MLRQIIALILLLVSPLAFSQVLADYELEDLDGNKHQVFDILEEGKPIVFYFFFVSCANCNSVTPALANLYDNFGGTEGCVEVLALNVSNDTHSQIQEYAADKNASFPFFSQDENPFILSFLSSFSEGSTIGTPAVLMFAPDHSLIYSGNGINVLSEGPMSSLVTDNTELSCTAAGLADEDFQFSIFPNPIDNGVALNLTVENTGTYDLDIVDAQGKKYFSQSQVLEHSNTINLPYMNPGLYFLTLTTATERLVTRFIHL